MVRKDAFWSSADWRWTSSQLRCFFIQWNGMRRSWTGVCLVSKTVCTSLSSPSVGKTWSQLSGDQKTDQAVERFQDINTNPQKQFVGHVVGRWRRLSRHLPDLSRRRLPEHLRIWYHFSAAEEEWRNFVERLWVVLVSLEVLINLRLTVDYKFQPPKRPLSPRAEVMQALMRQRSGSADYSGNEPLGDFIVTREKRWFEGASEHSVNLESSIKIFNEEEKHPTKSSSRFHFDKGFFTRRASAFKQNLMQRRNTVAWV